MKVLVVEDNPRKRESLISYYTSEFPLDHLEFADALIPGLRLARDSKPGLIILDMTLPNYSADENRGSHVELMPFAGREFTMRVNRMGFNTKIVIVSMFETFGVAPKLITLNSLDTEMHSQYPKIYGGAIHYSPSQNDWRMEIRNIRNQLEN